MKYLPDWRRVLNELQRYGASGEIDEGMLTNISDVNVNFLCELLKGKKYTEMRQWVVSNLDSDPSLLYRTIYNGLHGVLKTTSIPPAVVLIADYAYKSAFVADQEINLVACLTQIMSECEFS